MTCISVPPGDPALRLKCIKVPQNSSGPEVGRCLGYGLIKIIPSGVDNFLLRHTFEFKPVITVAVSYFLCFIFLFLWLFNIHFFVCALVQYYITKLTMWSFCPFLNYLISYKPLDFLIFLSQTFVAISNFSNSWLCHHKNVIARHISLM